MASTLTVRQAFTIRERRAALGISQQRLAELANCSLSMVRVLESGYEPESSRVLERIASVLTNDVAPAGNGRQVTTSAVSGDGHAK